MVELSYYMFFHMMFTAFCGGILFMKLLFTDEILEGRKVLKRRKEKKEGKAA